MLVAQNGDSSIISGTINLSYNIVFADDTCRAVKLFSLPSPGGEILVKTISFIITTFSSGVYHTKTEIDNLDYSTSHQSF